MWTNLNQFKTQLMIFEHLEIKNQNAIIIQNKYSQTNTSFNIR